jgi:hypothetical protein
VLSRWMEHVFLLDEVGLDLIVLSRQRAKETYTPCIVYMPTVYS